MVAYLHWTSGEEFELGPLTERVLKHIETTYLVVNIYHIFSIQLILNHIEAYVITEMLDDGWAMLGPVRTARGS